MELPPSSAMQAYLTQKYPPQAWAATAGELSWDDAALTKHFIDVFGVTMKVEENLYTFKYDQILCNKWLPHVRECRGIILGRFKNHWAVLSRPFDKFFNQFEGGCPVKRPIDFDKICSEFTIVEKVDGTCMQFWLDRRSKSPGRGNGRSGDEGTGSSELEGLTRVQGWRFSTLGSITAGAQFRELMAAVADIPRIESVIQETHTYLFELCCAANRIVTAYPTDRVYLLAARHRITGEPLPVAEVDTLAPRMKVMRPHYVMFVQLSITSLEDTIAYVEKEALSANYGNHPEGFCVYHRGVPLCKIKNKRYLEKHAMCTGDLLYQRNLVIGMFFEGTIDDYTELFSAPIKDFVEELRGKVRSMLSETEKHKAALLAHFKGEKPSRRLYADTVRELVPVLYQQFFLTGGLDLIFNPQRDVATECLDYLKKHYGKLSAIFKATKVQGILDREKKVSGEGKEKGKQDDKP